MSTPRVGAAQVMAGTVARLVLGAAGSVVIAALIGPSDKGVLATLIVLSAAASAVVGLGLNGAVGYYVATEKWSLPQSNALTLTWTIVSGVVAYAGFEALRALGVGSLLYGLAGSELAIATATMILLGLGTQALLAVKQFNLYARLLLLDVVANPALFFILRGAGHSNLTAALWAWIGGQLVVAVPIQLVLLHRGNWRLAPPSDPRGALWYGTRSQGSELLNLVNLRLDVLMLRMLSTTAATGAYALATQLAELVWVVPSSVGVTVFPEVAGGGHERGTWTARVSRLSTAVCLLLCLVVGVGGTVLIGVFLPQYTSALPALWLLLPGAVVSSTAKVLGNDLRARGIPQTVLAAMAAGVLVTIVGDIALVPRLGASGAAVVSSAAYALSAFILVRFFTSHTGIRARELLPGPSDSVDALRIARRTVSESLHRAQGTIEA